MSDFDDFWQIVKSWRHPRPNPPKPAAIAWHRAIKEGAVAKDIINGARGYDAAMISLNQDSQFYNTAAKFLSEWRWMQYQGYCEEQQAEAGDRQAELEKHQRRMRMSDLLGRRKREKQMNWNLLTDQERAEVDAYLARQDFRVVG